MNQPIDRQSDNTPGHQPAGQVNPSNPNVNSMPQSLLNQSPNENPGANPWHFGNAGFGPNMAQPWDYGNMSFHPNMAFPWDFGNMNFDPNMSYPSDPYDHMDFYPNMAHPWPHHPAYNMPYNMPYPYPEWEHDSGNDPFDGYQAQTYPAHAQAPVYPPGFPRWDGFYFYW